MKKLALKNLKVKKVSNEEQKSVKGGQEAEFLSLWSCSDSTKCWNEKTVTLSCSSCDFGQA
ncbi:hypothetical protein D0817_06475 [Flavobacterium cupreum]|uniref:Uncharacterized protein n=2 Tax=Flavobacterium TaxID=237 RepID=A0A4Y7UEX9_9FLAO|nr:MULTISPECIES: hypothetical protein [Flavobacterium]RUT71517.1 hypothetical protein D0817_06475 [Flavobacterium cupreum]TCN59653.1 hypothetical protein EV142_102271 [Flavobacterium circumlabens]TEB44924.1 hypothetical protein D0809_06995 [Flavobacterium circumlabens]